MGESELIRWVIAYSIIGIIFLVAMFYFISEHKNGVNLTEDFYAKEIARVIETSQLGTEVRFDVTNAMKLAQKNGVSDLSKIVSFDNEKNEVIVKLSDSSGRAFSYFKNVVIFEPHIEYASEDLDTNQLVFEIHQGRASDA